MTAPLPFTQLGIERAIRGAEKAGKVVIGVMPHNGMLVFGDKPVETAAVVPPKPHDVPGPSKWEDGA